MKLLPVAVGIVFDSTGRVLITQRALNKPYASYWEFPGGKIESNESPSDALVREMSEEVGITCTDYQDWLVHEHAYSDVMTVQLHVFIVSVFRGKVACLEGQQGYQWVELNTLKDFSFPDGNDYVIEQLLKEKSLA